MNSRPFLSIIIPVYNVEKYLNQCIDSVIKQDLSNIEIILIDDGSTDDSGKICDMYKEKYNSVSIIHQSNTGLSGARNAGIKRARGKYLMFIDSDDFITDKVNFVDIFNECTEDIIQYKWAYYYNQSRRIKFFRDIDVSLLNSYADFMSKLSFLINDGSISISACNKVVKRELIIKNNLFFKEGLISEDIDWSLRLYLCAHSIRVLNENIYFYRQQREGSISNTYSDKRIDSLIYIINYWYNYNYSNINQQRIYYNYLAYWYLILLCFVKKAKHKKKLTKYSTLLNYDGNYKVKKALRLKKFVGMRMTIICLKIYFYLHSKGMFSI